MALATYLGATEASLDSRQADACGKDGYIRAYDAANGRLLWEFNTARTFPTVNGVGGHGGSINYAGAVVAGGMVYVTSGYSTNAGMPGNGLLAFSVDGK